MHRSRVVGAAMAILAVVGCRTQDGPRTPVARIDNTTLTLEDIAARFDSGRGISQAQIQQYVQRWIVDEVLYQEAVRRGLDRSDVFNRRMDDLRRQLAIQALLDREVYTPPSAAPTQEELDQYYEGHRQEFLLREDVALVSYVLFGERDAATGFRNTVLRGTLWHSALQAQAPAIRAGSDSVYHTQASLLPAELWRVASNARPREPSFPVSTARGYYILVVWKYQRQGLPADLAYVSSEIQGRLAVERRRRLYRSLVENLRSRHAVQILTSFTGADTVAVQPVE